MDNSAATIFGDSEKKKKWEWDHLTAYIEPTVHLNARIYLKEEDNFSALTEGLTFIEMEEAIKSLLVRVAKKELSTDALFGGLLRPGNICESIDISIDNIFFFLKERERLVYNETLEGYVANKEYM